MESAATELFGRVLDVSLTAAFALIVAGIFFMLYRDERKINSQRYKELFDLNTATNKALDGMTSTMMLLAERLRGITG